MLMSAGLRALLSADRRPGRLIGLAAAAAVGLSAIFTTGGCASDLRRKQLQNVAKDWCESIRASQVMPVYPLTEDLRPGDVFLVRASQAEQDRVWRERGFLPLDDFRARLKVTDYTAMYFDGYWDDDFGGRAHPRPVLKAPGTLPDASIPADRRYSTIVEAPRAAFPTYSFEATTSQGLSLAVPVHGIPVGLNYLNADRAAGTISIADAYTYSADPDETYQKLLAWASQPRVRAGLRETAKSLGRPVFLRVVTRVYMTGAISVSLTASRTSGGGGRAGAAPDLNLVTADGQVNQNYEKLLAELGRQASKPPIVVDGKILPGAAVKFSAASARAVAMTEAFDTPLVIGYVGFDVAVGPEGEVSPPIPTFQRVEGISPEAPLTMNQLSENQQDLLTSIRALRGTLPEPGGPAKVIAAITAVLDKLKDPELERARAAITAAATPPDAAAAEAVIKEFSIRAINFASIDGNRGPRYNALVDSIRTSLSGR